MILWAVKVSLCLDTCSMLIFLGKVRPGLWSVHSEEGGQGPEIPSSSLDC